MINNIDPDAMRPNKDNQPLLPFPGGDLDRSGIRLTKAEFSRFMGVSKQTAGDWVRSGKVTMGADGRLDPRQAVSQLLRSTDPARLRSKVLMPLVKDVGQYQQRIADLERDLALAKENETFAEAGVIELLDMLAGFKTRLELEWAELRELDTDIALGAIFAWLKAAEKRGADPGLGILSFASTGDEPEPLGALSNSGDGAGKTA